MVTSRSVLAVQALAFHFVVAVIAQDSMAFAKPDGVFVLSQAVKKDDSKTGTPETGSDEVAMPPPERRTCYREVRQADCDCMKYRKTGNQFQPLDCVASTYCEDPGQAC